MIDQALIRGVKNKDEHAFRMMYEGTIAYVYSIVHRYVSNESDYKDVIQEIYARVYIGISTFEESKGDFKYWLRKVAINQCLKNYNNIQKKSKVISLENASIYNPVEDDLWSKISLDDLQSLLHGMPKGYRFVFSLIVFDEYSHKEVSEVLDISVETSRSQYHKAKKWLKDRWRQNGAEHFLAIFLLLFNN